MSNDRSDIATRIVALLLGLFLFLGFISIAGSQIALGLAIGVATVASIVTRTNPLKAIPYVFIVAVALWLAWLVVASLVSDNSAVSLTGLRDNWLFLVIPTVMFVWRKHADLVIRCLVAGMILAGLAGIWQYLLGGTPFHSTALVEAPGFGHRATGYFSGLVTYGNLFAISVVGLFGLLITSRGGLNRVTTRVAWVAVAVGSCAVFLNFGRASIGGLLMTIFVTLTIASKSKRWLVLVAPTLLILAAILVPGIMDRFRDGWDKDFGGTIEGGRVFIWKQTLPLVTENPLFGIGPANFRTEYTKRLRPDVSELHKHPSAHNDFLNIAATTGLPGLLLYLVLWIVILRILLRAVLALRAGPNPDLQFVIASLTASVCFLGLSLFHDPFYDEEVRQVLMFFWAIGLASGYKTATEAGADKPPQTP